MGKIAFATPPSIVRKGALEYPVTYPPLGILYLASSARNSLGAKVIAIDGTFEGEKKFFQKLSREKPEIVCLSFSSHQASDASACAKIIRAILPEAKIVAGGNHPTFFPEESAGLFDYVSIGEGEATIPELAESIFSGKEEPSGVDGLCYKNPAGRVKFTRPRKPEKDLGKIPFPARDLLDIRKYPGFFYQKKRPDTSIISSRGCPYKCTFCSKIFGDIQRARSPSDIADELEILSSEGVREIYDWADEFNLVPKKSEKVLSEIESRKLDLSLKSHFRANGITKDYARRLSSSGFWLANVGIESANERTLRGIKKGITIPMAKKALLNLKDAGIKTLGFFMGFNVWEDSKGKAVSEGVAETKRTLLLIRSLLKEKLLNYFTFSLPTPYPGSRLEAIARKNGLVPKASDYSDYTSHSLVMELPGVSEREVLQVVSEAKSLQAKASIMGGDLNASLLGFYLRNWLEGRS